MFDILKAKCNKAIVDIPSCKFLAWTSCFHTLFKLCALVQGRENSSWKKDYKNDSVTFAY